MIAHATIRCLFVGSPSDPAMQALTDYLTALPHIRLDRIATLPDELGNYEVVLTTQAMHDPEQTANLEAFVRAGNGWLFLVREPLGILPDIFGAHPEPIGSPAELRILFDQPDTPLALRLPEAIYVSGERLVLAPDDPHARTLLYADWHYTHRAVITVRAAGEGHAAATSLHALDHPGVQQIVHRLIRQLAGRPWLAEQMGTAILGYAPSVGRLHGLGINATPGLDLKAVCDIDHRRQAQAQIDFPGLTTYTDADRLAEDPDVGLVIVATPPNTHAHLSMQMMCAGKHVVCEKPLALSRAQTDPMVALADRAQVLLCCHQNRRFDVDYLAIRQAIAEGWIGDLFYMETFVGGFDHPCGYWHSHAPVCGGTTYDWGGHYLDWIVGLMPSPVVAVQGSRHKRVWHDVTNADQERILMRFSHGEEAEFLHSDIAAARKPKWYLLGTRGAIVGEWQDVTVHLPDPVHYFETHAIPATEMPPRLTLYQRDDKGYLSTRPLVLPRREPFAFHRNLADHIHLGEPLAAPLEDAVSVVAILEAAGRSAACENTWEVLND